jgi:hypothetical protein
MPLDPDRSIRANRDHVQRRRETATIDEFRDELGEMLLVMRVHQGSWRSAVSYALAARGESSDVAAASIVDGRRVAAASCLARRWARPKKSGQGQALDHENRKTPISKPAANAQRPNVQAETTRTKLRRSCGISWDRSVIAAAPLRSNCWGRPLWTGKCPAMDSS